MIYKLQPPVREALRTRGPFPGRGYQQAGGPGGGAETGVGPQGCGGRSAGGSEHAARDCGRGEKAAGWGAGRGLANSPAMGIATRKDWDHGKSRRLSSFYCVL